jgi:hypothetical protein
MVWLGLALGIIDIWKADKLFFQLFENIFERAVASVCHSGTSRPGFEAFAQPKIKKSSNGFSHHRRWSLAKTGVSHYLIQADGRSTVDIHCEQGRAPEGANKSAFDVGAART